ncbi:MAG: Ig-like domain-containing protein, partial [Deltaproteobacteria bacterium]|nr:Ig-like domain-containing protein [Deltaproteobacteria bacterium]
YSKNGATGATGATGSQGITGPTGPTVTWVMPVQGATGVYIDSVIKVGFSKPISSSTINASTFMISTGGVTITGTVSYNSGSQTAYFNPYAPLVQFGSYTATLTTGVKDTSGNPLLNNYTWTFMAGGSSAPSRLYVTNENLSSSLISVFNNATMASGNIAPDRTIAGAATLLTGPEGMWFDKTSDRLYIPNWNANNITVFNSASTINGNTVPSRTISGASTALSIPTGIWLDTASDRLYVANFGGAAILVFNNASTLNGNTAPSRTVSGASTTFANPHSLWLDTVSDTLYVDDIGSNAILIFSNASTMNGNTAPSRTVSGASTTLLSPSSLWVDTTSDTLYVANSGGDAILAFNNASTINGNIAPSRAVSGASTTLNSPYGMWLDTASDRLYVANLNGDSILIFNNASSINGNVAPSRTISGASTQLTTPAVIWLDLNP